MKKLLFSLFTLFMGGGAMAQTITVPDVNASAGQTVAFSLNLVGGKADTYTSLQFDAQFPATGFTTTGAFAISPSWPAASCTVGDVDDTGLATIPFASAEAIIGSDVNYLATISFLVDESVDPGEYEVTLKNIVLGYGMTDKDQPEDVTFKVIVNDKGVTLDENSALAPEKTDANVDIIVFRTINANEWSTICLPFAMSADKWKAAFGEDAEIRPFEGYEKDGENLLVKVGNKVTAAMTAANTYFIKVSSDITDFTVNAKITRTDAPRVAQTEEDPETGEEVELSYMQGTYVAGTVVPAQNLFLNDNKFYYSKGKTFCKGYRAYLWLTDVLDGYDSSAAAPVIMVFDNETTGISDIQNKAVDSNIYYNLNGQQIENPAKGLFIKNGKKYVIK